MSFHKFVLNFNAGELSPFLAARTDLAKYESGCQTLENFIILPYGGVVRRPGTQYLGAAKLADKRCRLIGFNFSVTTNFILEVGEKYLRFWTEGVQVQLPQWFAKEVPAWVTAASYQSGSYVLQGAKRYRCVLAHQAGVFATDLADGDWVDVHPTSTPPAWVTAHAYVLGDQVNQTGKDYRCLVAHTSGTFATDLAGGKWEEIFRLKQSGPFELATPYLESELRDIQYCQVNDLMYLTHPDHEPWKLTRQAVDDWRMGPIVWAWPPTLEENVENVTLKPSAASGNITLTASAATFKAGHAGSYWQIGHRRGDSSVEIALSNANTTSSSLYVLGSWEFITYGSWKGTVFIERILPDKVSWEILRTYESSVLGQRNVSTTGSEDTATSLRIRFTAAGEVGTSDPIARLVAGDARVYGFVQITGVTSPTVANAAVKKNLLNANATYLWSEAALSTESGFARTVTLHENRLVFGGTRSRPLALFGSQIDDFENFLYGALDDDAFFFNISANESNPINWTVSQQQMLIGTAGDEWSVGATNTDQAMGPGNVQAKQQSSYGSAFLQAEVVNEVILFGQRQGHKIREMTYNFEKDGWVSPDLTVLASHISDKGFVETAFAQQPDAIYWTITAGGRLVGMTYERDQNVVGWHRHSTEGEFESVATVYGGSDADEVWFAVKRLADGVTVRYIERFDTNFRVALDEGDKDNWWYLDSAKRVISPSEITHVTGLDHLNENTVGILGDGANQPVRTVAAGAIDLQEPAKNILVGLPYTSLVKPMNINMPAQDGTAQGRRTRIHKMAVRFYKSLTCQYSSDDTLWDEIFFRDRDDVMDASPSVFTGDREVATGTNFRNNNQIALRQNRPFPLAVLAMVLWADHYGE